MAYTLTRETEMTVADMGLVLCAAAALEIKKKKKKKIEEEARRRVQVKRRKKLKDWLKRRVQLGHNMTLLYELEEEDLPASRIISEWTQIHLMRFWRECYTWVLKMEEYCW